MTDLLIPPELAAKLAALAQHEQRTIPELLEAMLAQYHPAEITESAPDVPEAAADMDADRDAPPLGTLARLAYEADQWGFASGLTDSVERSRKILETEFGKVSDAQAEALMKMIGMFDDDVTDLSTTVRETMEKFWRDKTGDSD